jgi:CRISPR/Cas system CSM-associated protein Csm2 small subunit
MLIINQIKPKKRYEWSFVVSKQCVITSLVTYKNKKDAKRASKRVLNKILKEFDDDDSPEDIFSHVASIIDLNNN